MWRLRRLERAETALFHSLIYRLKADQLATEVRSYQQDFADHLAIALRPEITDKAAHMEASEALKRAQYEQNRDEVLLGRAIDADAKEGDAFAKLARYERSLERSFHRALDELRRMQDKRQSCPSPPILDAITLNCENTE
jgi:hypothetical protein